jgi:carbon-monoxide dehydrogenase large subunit
MEPVYSAILGVPAEKIRIHADDVGGAFGVRSSVFNEYIALMIAAQKLGKPVKWLGSRFESIVSDYHGRGNRLTGELALDADGHFLGLRYSWLCDMGAYLSQSGPLISSINPSTHGINAYRISAFYGRNRLALTNTTPTSAYRGAGRPNVSYCMERLVDEAAVLLGIDRIELRRRNVIPKEAYPYKTPVGSTYDSGDFPGQLSEAAQLTKWASFEERRTQARRRGRLRGIGCAAFCEPSGSGQTPRSEAAILFDEQGNAVLHTLGGPSGQGHETVFPEIVSGVFGMPAERIRLRSSDPAGPALTGGGTVGSRSMLTHGAALFATAHTVVKKGMDLAAKDLEVSPADLEFTEGAYRVKGTDLAVSLEALAKKHGKQLDTVDGVPTPTAFPGGVHIAEVEIDPETGAIEVLDYVGVDDCGRVLNHTLLEAQLHGGIMQGIGQVLAEHCQYDESGQLLTGSFMDYAMPRAEWAPEPRLFDRSVPSPTNPLGVKGVGEAGTVGAIPTIANAVLDALRPVGVRQLDFPFTPARVWQAIAKAARA